MDLVLLIAPISFAIASLHLGASDTIIACSYEFGTERALDVAVWLSSLPLFAFQKRVDFGFIFSLEV
jgi:hypothetical protein